MSLFEKYRPKSLTEVIGQGEVIKSIDRKLTEKTWPAASILIGTTGTGKTSTARIIAGILGCNGSNIKEINCADVRGIDSVREMEEETKSRPLLGKSLVFILDEVVQLPKATQQAALGLLESSPHWVYFILCTTEISGLLPTFMGRCYKVHFQPMQRGTLEDIILHATKGEGRSIEFKVVNEIVSKANGSARNALQLLESVLAHDDEATQLKVLGMVETEIEKTTEFLAKALLRQAGWRDVAAILKPIKNNEAESIRWPVLDYMAAVLLNSENPIAYKTIKAFQNSFMSSGRAGLAAACLEALGRQGRP